MYQEQENSVGNSRFILPHIELSSRCKANINAADRNGETPLHSAAKKNRLEQVKLLLKKGAVIDIKNRFVNTPSYHAVRFGHTSMVKLLLGKGADIKKSSNSCVTVLHLSVLKDYREITRLLLGETESPRTSCRDANVDKVQTTQACKISLHSVTEKVGNDSCTCFHAKSESDLQNGPSRPDFE